MTTDGHAAATRRDQLLLSVATRVDLAADTGDGGPVHDPDAWREGEGLMSYLATAAGVDEEVLYVLGMLYLARTVMAGPSAGDAEPATASTRAATTLAPASPPGRVLAWVMLAPFYFHPAGARDLLEPPTRELLRQMHDGPRQLDRAARELGHVEALSDLGMFLLAYRITTGDTAIARSAAAVLRAAAGESGAGYPQRPVILCNLGYALITGDAEPEQFREAVGVFRESFRLTPAAHPSYPRCANGLGLALLGEAQFTQNRGNLAEAAEMLRLATRGATEQYANLGQMFSDLGMVLAKWVNTADIAQARDPAVLRASEEAVAAHRRALDLTPEADPNRGGRLARLAEAEQVRARLKNLAGTSEIDELLPVVERRLAEPAPEPAPELEPAPAPELEPAPGSLLRLGLEVALTMLKMFKLRLDVGADFEAQQGSMQALQDLARDVQDVLPRVMTEVASSGTSMEGLTGFSQTWVSPFEVFVLLDEALPGYRHVLAELSAGSPQYAQVKTSLALMLFYRHSMSSDEESYAEAVGLARELIAATWPPSPVILVTWAMVAVQRAQFAILGWEDPALDTFPEGNQGLSGSPITRLATTKAAAALADENAAAALEALEDGRAYLLSAALNTRRELETLRGADAELYARLVRINEEFLNWQRSSIGTRMGHVPSSAEMTWYRTRSAEGANLVEELRRRPGFDQFLMPRPLRLADLQPAADGGPVVSVNINPRRCDALALTRDGLRAISLPRLSAADLAEQASALSAAVEILGGGQAGLADAARPVFAGVLGWLWDVLAEPVLEALGYVGPPGQDGPWPRIWWSPTGLLNMFPLHAAGYHDRPGASVLDRVASSYTPTLRALLASRARASRVPIDRGGSGRRVLTVAMPQTPGHAPLAATAREATAAAGTDGLCLIGAGATRDAVLAALPGAAIAHFACHARSDPDEPTASRLLLHDGNLLISDLTRLQLAAAELAYLSACGTTRRGSALAGEEIHLASAFQLAGYCQSVATCWEIADGFAATAASRFHEILASALPDPGPLPAALALHLTVRELRQALPGEPWLWSALLHAGV